MEEHLLAVVGGGFAVILLTGLIGNYINFTNPIYNALITAVIWGVLFAVLNWLYGRFTDTPLLTWEHFPNWAAIGVILAFVSDFIGNTLSFKSPYANAIATAVVWTVFFYIIAVGLLHYWTGQWIFV
jgi:hypothetical protein